MVQRCHDLPAADLVLVQAGEAFRGLEGFLDAPALSSHPYQRGQWHAVRDLAAQVGQLAGGIVAADQQMMLPVIGLGVLVMFG